MLRSKCGLVETIVHNLTSHIQLLCFVCDSRAFLDALHGVLRYHRTAGLVLYMVVAT